MPCHPSVQLRGPQRRRRDEPLQAGLEADAAPEEGGRPRRRLRGCRSGAFFVRRGVVDRVPHGRSRVSWTSATEGTKPGGVPRSRPPRGTRSRPCRGPWGRGRSARHRARRGPDSCRPPVSGGDLGSGTHRPDKDDMDPAQHGHGPSFVQAAARVGPQARPAVAHSSRHCTLVRPALDPVDDPRHRLHRPRGHARLPVRRHGKRAPRPPDAERLTSYNVLEIAPMAYPSSSCRPTSGRWRARG